MQKQYGLFEKQLYNKSGNERLDILFKLLTSKEGRDISLSHYLQENHVISDQRDSEENSNEKTSSFSKVIKPCLMISRDDSYVFQFANIREIAQKLKTGEVSSVFESQTRCKYKKDEFIKNYGEFYQKPLHAFLKGRASNDECDGIVSLTIDFDSDATIELISSLINSSKNNILNVIRSKSFYADSVAKFALLFSEFIPKDLDPTSIRFTGNGFQFIYALENPFYFNKKTEDEREKQKNFVLDTILWLRRSLEIELEKFNSEIDGVLPEGVSFHIDKAFERNLYQTRRVPGSFNSKTGLSAAYILLQEHSINLRETLDYCKENYRDAFIGEEYKKNIFNSDKSYSKEDALNFAKCRLESLTDIVKFRVRHKNLIGSRHNILTQISNSIADVLKIKNDNNEPSVVELLGKVVTFNADHFKDAALNFGEVKSIVKGVLKRRAKLLNNGHNTNLTNKTIINYLDLTNKEQSLLKRTSQQAKRAKDVLRNKYSLESKVIHVHQLKKQGFSYKQIANITGFPLSTVYRYDTVVYPKQKKENLAKTKREKERLKHELKTTQKAVFDFMYDHFTKMIILKKTTIGLKRVMKKNSRVKSTMPIIVLFADIFYKVMSKIFKHKTISELISIRNFVENEMDELFNNKILKEIINECTVIFELFNKGLDATVLEVHLQRIETYLSHIISIVISKRVFHEKHVRVSLFLPNPLLKDEYEKLFKKLPFPEYYLEQIKL